MDDLSNKLVGELTGAEMDRLARERALAKHEAYEAELRRKHREAQAEYDREDAAYAATFGLTLEQYHEIGCKYRDDAENRW